ncbi:MAG: LamG domain-containing protein [Acidobacteriota bacterium]|nr:LamG domain-containing protein [Acidobacteriota bacterium]
MAPHDENPDRELDTTADVTRRQFLKTVGTSGVATTLVGATSPDGAESLEQSGSSATERPSNAPPYAPIREEVAENLRRRGLTGYADRLSVEPGGTVRFMVSSERSRYRADIVRLIHGDANPDGPGVKERLIDTIVSGEYPGRRQTLPMGSYVTVPDDPALRLTGSFTVTAWIAPTSQRGDSSSSGSVFVGAEGVVTKWAGDRGGYGVFIDEGGRLSVRLRAPNGDVDIVRADRPLRPWVPAIFGMNNRPQGVATAWYFVAASFDAETGRIVLVQDPATDFSFDPTRVTTERTTTIRSLASVGTPLLIAAAGATDGGIVEHYNGKIENPRLYGRALTRAEIEAVRDGDGPTDVIATWDFARDIESDAVSDTASRGLHGRTVNLPARAMTGHNWDSTETDYRRASHQYGAIHFHDDDLDDARWDVDFTLTVPPGLPSGLYAARLRADTVEDYVPFVVRPRRGTATSRIALVIPTFSYLAYGGTGTSAFRPLSLYSRHSDGSGVCYSSRLRPITNMRPKIQTNNPWQFMADTHLVDWLDTKGFEVDVLTDDELHDEGLDVLAPYAVVLTGTHPEYYSLSMLEALRAYLNQGGRLMYMGGNGFYWVTVPDPTGRYVEVRRRDGTEHWQGAPGEHHHSLTGEPGGLWRFRGMAPQQFFGVGFTAQGFDRNAPYRRTPDSTNSRVAWIFEGVPPDALIGNFPSLVLEFGAAGSELDRADYDIGTPAHTLVLASSFGHSNAYQHVVEQINTSNGARPGGRENPLVRADMVYLEYPNGGAVFSTSSIAWCGSLSFNNYTNDVSRITENVLRRFATDAALPPPTRPGTNAD